ncbi:hypothetical protein MUN82_06340 [Hymenobacter aerilatus]|uniref:Uncharacterized protein n=1 Tax=Hymenobacter aerilatus TaxID=2932251 RepID=A0A8T9T157_9BACT|nr:hypothetical protein [Hymenobacter aerilatus]UOR06713.1 hypothetical protein MUN82_06340 [Hymenobacter aerilatus]
MSADKKATPNKASKVSKAEDTPKQTHKKQQDSTSTKSSNKQPKSSEAKPTEALSPKSTRTISDIYESFSDNIKSIDLFFDRLSPAAETEDEAANSDFINFIEETVEEIIEDIQNDPAEAESKLKNLTPENRKNAVNGVLDHLKTLSLLSTTNLDILARGSFIMLNNYFEYIFSDLLTYFYLRNSSIIDNRKMSISIGELKKYSSIDDAYEDIIYKEVESTLLDLNFEELKNYFKDKLKIDLEEDIINWDFINETRERRHIIVHNNSVINNKYLSRSKNIFNLELNKIITIDKEYFKNALSELRLAGTLLIINFWGKLDKDKATDAIKELMDLSFNFLKTKDYQSVINICKYTSKRIKPNDDEQEELVIRIKYNHCLALMRSNQQKELDEIMKYMKTGALSPIFKIAHCVLKNNLDDAVKLIPKAIHADDLTLDDYDDWPLFDEIRLNEELNQQALEFFAKEQPQ